MPSQRGPATGTGIRATATSTQAALGLVSDEDGQQELLLVADQPEVVVQKIIEDASERSGVQT